MKKILIASIIVIVILLVTLWLFMYKITHEPYPTPSCEIMRPIYSASYPANSEEQAKDIVREYFISENFNFSEDNLTVETNEDYYLVVYEECHIDPNNWYNTSIERNMYGFGKNVDNCGGLAYQVKENTILARFPYPC